MLWYGGYRRERFERPARSRSRRRPSVLSITHTTAASRNRSDKYTGTSSEDFQRTELSHRGACETTPGAREPRDDPVCIGTRCPEQVPDSDRGRRRAGNENPQACRVADEWLYGRWSHHRWPTGSPHLRVAP